MIELQAIKSEKIWGYELWIASTHPNGKQDDFEALVGGDYPLLIKVIQANDTLSVQVHPDDERAAEWEGSRGKTECWYVLDAAKDARLIYGMNGHYTNEELRAAIEQNRLESYMRFVTVKKGDFAYIPAGTVHAIGGGLRLLEVQQSSDITYRLYDWGRGRECHIEKGIKSIKEFQNQQVIPFPGTFVCPYFCIEELCIDGSLEGSFSNEAAGLLFVVDGEGTIGGTAAKAEHIFAFKGGEHFVAKGRLHLMKITPRNS